MTTIDPAKFVEAADAFDTVSSSALNYAIEARGALSAFGGMAGTDPGGEAFAEAYDSMAVAALQRLYDVGVVTRSLDRSLMATAGTHAQANENAARTGVDVSGSYTLRPEIPPTTVAEPPTAFGGRPDTIVQGMDDVAMWVWDQILNLIGTMYPDGDPETLEGAGRAWDGILSDITSLRTDIRLADNAITGQDTPEVAQINEKVNELADGLTTFVGTDDGIGAIDDICRDYAQTIRDTREETRQMLVQLVIEIAAGIGISAVLSAFTFGLAGIAGGAAITARIGTIALRIGSLVARCAEKGSKLAIRLNRILQAMRRVGQAYPRLAKAGIEVISSTGAAVTAETVQGNEANYGAAIIGGVAGGGVTAGIVAPFGRHGERFAVQALANGVGGVGGTAADMGVRGEDITVGSLVTAAAIGVGTSVRLPSRKKPTAGGEGLGGDGLPPGMARTPGRTNPGAGGADLGGNNTVIPEGEAPSGTGGAVTGSGGDGGGSPRTEYDGPTGAGGDVGGSGGDGGGASSNHGDAPAEQEIVVTPEQDVPGDAGDGPGTPGDDGPGTGGTDAGSDGQTGGAEGPAGDDGASPAPDGSDGGQGAPQSPEEPRSDLPGGNHGGSEQPGDGGGSGRDGNQIGGPGGPGHGGDGGDGGRPPTRGDDEPDADADPNPDADAEPTPDADAEPTPDADAEPTPDADAEPTPDADAEPTPDADADPKPDTDAEPMPDADADPKPDADAEPAPDADAEPTPDADAEPTPDADADPMPDADADPTPDADAEPTPDADAAPKPDADAEPAPDAESDTQSQMEDDGYTPADGAGGKDNPHYGRQEDGNWHDGGPAQDPRGRGDYVPDEQGRRTLPGDPDGTFRDANGRLHDAETGRFVVDPNTPDVDARPQNDAVLGDTERVELDGADRATQEDLLQAREDAKVESDAARADLESKLDELGLDPSVVTGSTDEVNDKINQLVVRGELSEDEGRDLLDAVTTQREAMEDLRDASENLGDHAAESVARSRDEITLIPAGSADSGQFDHVTISEGPPVTLHIYEGKGGDSLNLGGRTVDGVHEQQGTGNYANDIAARDERLREQLAEYVRNNPDSPIAQAIREGRLEVDYTLVHGRSDGGIDVTEFEIDPGSISIPPVS